jgi:hypothetical protein
MPTSFLAPTKDLENQMFLVDPAGRGVHSYCRPATLTKGDLSAPCDTDVTGNEANPAAGR